MTNLALFSYGVVLAESSRQMWIARKVARGERVTSAARRLRRFIDNEKWAGEQYFLDWSASGKVFKKRGRIPAHVRAIWDQGCAELWLLVANDQSLSGTEYAQRNWQEQTFRDLKSGGWDWLRSYLRCPQKMSRFLAILVLAYTWMISFGSHAVEQGRARRLVQDKTGKWRCQWSLFKEGLQFFTEYAVRKGISPPLRFVADRRLC